MFLYLLSKFMRISRKLERIKRLKMRVCIWRRGLFKTCSLLTGFDDYTLFQPCNDDVLLVDDVHVLDSRLNPSKEGEDDTVQHIVRPWVTRDRDSIWSLGLRRRPFGGGGGCSLGFRLVFHSTMRGFHLGMHSVRLGLLVLMGLT